MTAVRALITTAALLSILVLSACVIRTEHSLLLPSDIETGSQLLGGWSRLDDPHARLRITSGEEAGILRLVYKDTDGELEVAARPLSIRRGVTLLELRLSTLQGNNVSEEITGYSYLWLSWSDAENDEMQVYSPSEANLRMVLQASGLLLSLSPACGQPTRDLMALLGRPPSPQQEGGDDSAEVRECVYTITGTPSDITELFRRHSDTIFKTRDPVRLKRNDNENMSSCDVSGIPGAVKRHPLAHQQCL